MIEILDRNLKKKDILRKYTFAQYVNKFRDVGTFKVNAQLIEENLYLLDKDEQYYFLFDGKIFGMVQSVKKTGDEEFGKVIEIQGSLAPVLFTKRIVHGTLKFSGNTSEYIKELIYQNITKDKTSDRYVNINIQYDDESYLKEICSKVDKQVTGGYVWDEIQPVMEQDNLGIFFTPIITTAKVVDGVETNVTGWNLVISCGKDRRKGNKKGNVPVIFSQSLGNVERTDYSNDTKSFRNVSYVAGEGEGNERKWYVVDINSDINIGSKKGFGRSELWIDARDIQSNLDDGTNLTESEYETLIRQRANEKAAENTIKESYSSTIVEQDKKYVFGEDYDIGDIVTVIDKNLNITVDAQITQVTKTIQGSGEILDIDFTYGAIKRNPIERIEGTSKRVEKTENDIKHIENKTNGIEKQIEKIKEDTTKNVLLWSGTLKKGESVTLSSEEWKKYKLFAIKTSDGLTMLMGFRVDSGNRAYIRFVGASDDGANSFVFHANTVIDISTNIFYNISCSIHKYITSSTGTGMAENRDIKELYGIV